MPCCGLGFGVWGLGFGVWGLGFGVWGLGFGVFGFGVLGLEFGPNLIEQARVCQCLAEGPVDVLACLRVRVWGLGFGVWRSVVGGWGLGGLGFWVLGFGFGIYLSLPFFSFRSKFPAAIKISTMVKSSSSTTIL